MKEILKEVLKVTREFWEKLPTEIKVAVYYAGTAGLNIVAETLLGFEPIQWEVLVRLLIGNVILVFIQNLPKRISK